MKKGKLICIFILVLVLCSGCTSGKSGKLESITYKEYQELIENKETFVLEMWRTSCGHCQDLKPKIQKFVKEYGVTIKTINLDTLSVEDQKNMRSAVGTDATPIIFFYKDGEETSVTTRLVGDAPYDRIIEKFKENKVIE